MTYLLLVEDQPKDLKIAAETARSAGINELKALASSEAAITYLRKGLCAEQPLPDGIVLDLDLGYESGHELLRFWHSTPELRKIPLIVWTHLGEDQREICNLFNVNCYVSKWEGIAPFREALSRFFPQQLHP